MNSSRLFLAVLTILLGYVSVVRSQVLGDGIVGHVEGEIVLMSDVQIASFQLQEAYPDQSKADLECMALDNLLMQKIFVIQAERDSIYVSDEEVDQELDGRIAYFEEMFGGLENLESYYGKTITELKADFREDIFDQLLSSRMEGNITAGISVSPSEVRSFYQAIPQDSIPFFNAEVELAEVVLYEKPTDDQNQVARSTAEELSARLQDGEDFEFLALVYSCDPGSSKIGGDLGFIRRGQMVSAFESAAFRLKNPMEISPVVETEFGFHIIQLLERQGERIHVRHILICPEMTDENLNTARREAERIRDKVLDGAITFEEAVEEYSMDMSSKNQGGLLQNQKTGNSFFEMDEVEGVIAVRLDDVEVGGYSQVIPTQGYRGERGYRFIRLVSETEAHQANIEQDYSKFKAVCLEQKKQKALYDWMNTVIPSIYIDVVSDYQTCPQMKNWKVYE